MVSKTALALALPLTVAAGDVTLTGSSSSINMRGARMFVECPGSSPDGPTPHVRYLTGHTTAIDVTQGVVIVKAVLGNVLTSCVDAGRRPCAALDPEEPEAFYCEWLPTAGEGSIVKGPLHASRTFDDPACTDAAAGCPIRVFVSCETPTLTELGSAVSAASSGTGYTGSFSLGVKHYLQRAATSTYEVDATPLPWTGAFGGNLVSLVVSAPAPPPPPLSPPPPVGVDFVGSERYTLSDGGGGWQVCGVFRSWTHSTACPQGTCHSDQAINGLTYLSHQWSQDMQDGQPNCELLDGAGGVARQGNCCADIDFSQGVKLKASFWQGPSASNLDFEVGETTFTSNPFTTAGVNVYNADAGVTAGQLGFQVRSSMAQGSLTPTGPSHRCVSNGNGATQGTYLCVANGVNSGVTIAGKLNDDGDSFQDWTMCSMNTWCNPSATTATWSIVVYAKKS